VRTQAPAARLAAQVLESASARKLECESALLAQLLEESFIVSYYADNDNRAQARACAALYAELANADPDFRDEFLLHEIRVRTNLGFVEQVV
jgi:hypothetical protein